LNATYRKLLIQHRCPITYTILYREVGNVRIRLGIPIPEEVLDKS
jgi:hypothetical protein